MSTNGRRTPAERSSSRLCGLVASSVTASRAYAVPSVNPPASRSTSASIAPIGLKPISLRITSCAVSSFASSATAAIA